MKTVLLTGFEPFGGEAINASEQIVRRLDGEEISGHGVRGVVLPCVFGAAERALFAAMKAPAPAIVVCLGQASGRHSITPELLAVNLDDARIPDNAGNQPVDTPVAKGGPAACWTTLPARRIVAALGALDIPAELSRTAGAFVCNHVFYALMHRMTRRCRPPPAGFIHVPAIGTPGVTLERMVEAIREALRVCLVPDVRDG